MMIGVTVIVGQARTIYIQLFALLCLLGLFRRKSLASLRWRSRFRSSSSGSLPPFKSRYRVEYRTSLAPFFIDHFAAMGGMKEGNDEGVSGAASGVPQRIGWSQKS